MTFQDFVGSCIDRKTGPDPSQQEVNDAMRDCVEIWKDAVREEQQDFEEPTRQELLQDARQEVRRS